MDDNGIRTHRKKSMSFSKSSLAAHKAISAIYLKVSRIYFSCIPDEKIQVNPEYWSGSEILV